MKYVKWTAENDATVKQLWEDGQTDETIAAYMGTTAKAIMNRRYAMRLLKHARVDKPRGGNSEDIETLTEMLCEIEERLTAVEAWIARHAVLDR